MEADMSEEDGKTNIALILGEVRGMMNGLRDTLVQQNLDSAKFRLEQMSAVSQNRQESMKGFEEIRNNNKEQAQISQKNQEKLGELSSWRTDAEPKINILWDKSNNQNGFIAALLGIGTLLGGTFVAALEYLKKG